MMSDPNEFNTSIIAEFRANDGIVGGPFAGAPIVLLSTTGAKTSLKRTHPLVYLADEGRLFVFASKAGAPAHPVWYTNLVANPEVEVELGTDKFSATAKPLAGEERDRIYAKQAGLFDNFREYEAATTRVIPVVELTRS
jgi:deazaflavin-dependent oxidoreductase (nitroreductase family)